MAQVFLGMSGGVDSSAAAVLLQEQGYAVSGLHLSLLSGLPLPADPPSRMTAPTPGPWHLCWGFPSTIWTSPRNSGQQLSTISSGNMRRATRRIPACSATGGSSSAPCGTLPENWGRTICHRPLRQNPTGSCHRPSPALPGGGPFQGPELLSLPVDAGAAFPDAVPLG